jgi:hypothetical protein
MARGQFTIFFCLGLLHVENRILWLFLPEKGLVFLNRVHNLGWDIPFFAVDSPKDLMSVYSRKVGFYLFVRPGLLVWLKSLVVLLLLGKNRMSIPT